jgi:uncharacterized protein HemX
MGMSRAEETELLERLERELPGKTARLSQMQANIRGLSGEEKLKAQRAAATFAMEVGGMKNTIKALKGRLGLK